MCCGTSRAPHASPTGRRSSEVARWERDPAVIDAWRDGRTGYPVVDAAMRQLRATGWMPNRARMIVASFLTKHLGVDWRVGEGHFMEHLLDGDPPATAAAGSGRRRPAPIPSRGSGSSTRPARAVRHDPEGDYVRRWVPELVGLPGAAVHEPPPGAYLPPIVDHATARRRALDAYRTASRR